MEKQLEEIRTEFEHELAQTGSPQELEELKVRYLGRKGVLTSILRQMSSLSAEDRPRIGALSNALKTFIDEQISARCKQIEQTGEGGIDITLPGRVPRQGTVHILNQVLTEIEEIFTQLGFAVASGPEVEDDYHNFEALNIPAHHPARDMQDTFWLTNGMLLRTHTSPCQVRAMERFGPPLRVIAPGRCFRYETIDASHENTFFQLEGLMIDKHISIANLIGIMKLLLREILKCEVTIRLRPGYFPFVEPGFELDMQCTICGGRGCATCKQSGWVEVLPCGMVHPNVLRAGRIDPHEYTGFAFGLGLTRLAMMKYGVSDIRILNSGDLRALVYPEKLSGPAITGQ